MTPRMGTFGDTDLSLGQTHRVGTRGWEWAHVGSLAFTCPGSALATKAARLGCRYVQVDDTLWGSEDQKKTCPKQVHIRKS